MAASSIAVADSIPSVVVTVKNQAAQRGALQTPVWVGAHDGTFDIYDRNVAVGDTNANPNLISRESVESIAEDGNTAPITAEFEQLQGNSPQATMVAPGGPLAPGAVVSTTLNFSNPQQQQYFSYASMIIPSNDFFVANGSPLAHPLFDDQGRFIGQPFIVAGSEVLDAGTEINDEIAANTAFLNQAGPNIGVDENGVVTLGTGFAAPGALTFPDGVLNYPVFANADYTADGARTLEFDFRYVDLGRLVRLAGFLSPENEVAPELVESDAFGRFFMNARNGSFINLLALFQRLTGEPVAAHLHLGQAGQNGPVVVDLGAGLQNNRVVFRIEAGDVVGPLAETDDPFLSLLNELAAGNIYVNIHTEQNPAGELRGQVKFR
ncbi:MAG: spondin domain-containing protein [Gammaproteobacteria bacterium]|nr:spondin domain-containing protein [Gammaproteobacteria bacterium]